MNKLFWALGGVAVGFAACISVAMLIPDDEEYHLEDILKRI